MSDSFAISQAADIVDFQLLAVVFALSTRDMDDQDAFIERVLSAIAKQSDLSLSKIAEQQGASDSLRNQLFAECADRVAQLKMAALGAARHLRA